MKTPKPRYLPDVNVLLALAWPNHQGHAAARVWFRENRAAGWVTCAITQLGFIRLSSNPAFTPDAVFPSQAAALLAQMTRMQGHAYLENLPEVALLPSALTAMPGHRQVTDAYLLQVAAKHFLTFVTFDRRARTLAGDEECVLLRFDDME